MKRFLKYLGIIFFLFISLGFDVEYFSKVFEFDMRNKNLYLSYKCFFLSILIFYLFQKNLDLKRTIVHLWERFTGKDQYPHLPKY